MISAKKIRKLIKRAEALAGDHGRPDVYVIDPDAKFRHHRSVKTVEIDHEGDIIP